MRSFVYALVFLLCVCFYGASASNLTFYFTNPSFGGNPMYGDFLLREAQMQNSFKEKVDEGAGFEMPTPLEDFQENLSREILYRLSQKIIDEAFGEDGVQEGHYQVGSYVIDVTPGSGGINVKIKDIQTGEQTVVQVPYY